MHLAIHGVYCDVTLAFTALYTYVQNKAWHFDIRITCAGQWSLKFLDDPRHHDRWHLTSGILGKAILAHGPAQVMLMADWVYAQQSDVESSHYL